MPVQVWRRKSAEAIADFLDIPAAATAPTRMSASSIAVVAALVVWVNPGGGLASSKTVRCTAYDF